MNREAKLTSRENILLGIANRCAAQDMLSVSLLRRKKSSKKKMKRPIE